MQEVISNFLDLFLYIALFVMGVIVYIQRRHEMKRYDKLVQQANVFSYLLNSVIQKHPEVLQYIDEVEGVSVREISSNN